MSSAFTHAVVGAAIGQAAPAPLYRWRVAVELAVIAAMPDLDVIGFQLGVPYQSPFGHRGLTHSFAFAAVIGLLYPSVLYRGVRVGSRTWCNLAALAFAACASHPLLDAFTDAGLGVELFWPFSTARFFFPWRPLPTSPLSARAFFQGRGVDILLAEFVWVWVPVMLLSIAPVVRRLRRQGGADPPPGTEGGATPRVARRRGR